MGRFDFTFLSRVCVHPHWVGAVTRVGCVCLLCVTFAWFMFFVFFLYFLSAICLCTAAVRMVNKLHSTKLHVIVFNGPI